MYQIKRKIAFSETAPDKKIRITELMDHYQDVCTAQSEELGVGMNDLLARGYGWVASSWQIVVNRYPELGEEVIVGTGPYEFKAAMGMRAFRMETADGEVLSYANSIWSFLDVEKMTLSRIPADISGAYTLIDKPEMDYAPRKISIPEELAAREPIAVSYHHLDSNGHVNNAQYISMVEDMLPEGRRPRQIRVEYRASARMGDLIMPYVCENPADDLYTVVLADTDMNPYVIVELWTKN